MNTDEVWRSVLGFEGVYEVSSLGNIRRIAKSRGAVPGRVLRPGTNRREGGYQFVFLYRDNRRNRLYVHRLVAAAFHGPAPDGCEVNHRDGDQSNCAASNLEWVTKSENARHAVNVLGRGMIGRKGGDNPTSRRYVVTAPGGEQIEVHGLQDFCARHGLDGGSMTRVAQGRWAHHRGWRCRYAEVSPAAA